MKNIFKDWSLFELIWLLLFSGVIIYLYFAWDDSFLGLISSLTGVFCVVLVAKGKISNYYFGIVNTASYAYIAFSHQLYGEVMLNAFVYFPMQFIGIYLWKKNQASKSVVGEDVTVSKLGKREWMIVAISVIIGVICYGSFLKYIDSAQPFIDAIAVTLSVTAQVLMLKRFAEQWLLWILVNIFSVILWVKVLIFNQGGNDYTMIVMWSAYLVNSLYGYYKWSMMAKKQKGALL